MPVPPVHPIDLQALSDSPLLVLGAGIWSPFDTLVDRQTVAGASIDLCSFRGQVAGTKFAQSIEFKSVKYQNKKHRGGSMRATIFP